MRRERIGNRRHRATFKSHNGTEDAAGHPTFSIEGDWVAVIEDWPCEMLSTSGEEELRGRQVNAHATHVLYGDFQSAIGVLPEMKCLVTVTTTGEVVTKNVIVAMDRDNDGREMLVELRD